MKSLQHFSCDLCAIRKQQCWSQNDTKPHKTGHLIIRLGKPVGGDEARCRLVFAGLLPRALVAQRIEQKTSKFLTPRLHRTVYRVVGERGVVVRLACNEKNALYFGSENLLNELSKDCLPLGVRSAREVL